MWCNRIYTKWGLGGTKGPLKSTSCRDSTAWARVSSWVIKVWISSAELRVQARGRWSGTGSRSATQAVCQKSWGQAKPCQSSKRAEQNARSIASLFRWKSLPHFILLTLKELPAACSSGNSWQGQPHNSVGSLFYSAQPFPHHMVELRHWCRNSWTQGKINWD